MCKAARAVLAALIVALLAGGCGGSGGDSADKRKALRQLNAICLAANEKAGAELLEVYDYPRVKRADSEQRAINLEVDFFVPILLVDAETQMEAIGRADVPSGDEEEVGAILDAYLGWIEQAKQDPLETVLANDVYNEARRLAARYGLDECGLTPFEVPRSPAAGEAQTS